MHDTSYRSRDLQQRVKSARYPIAAGPAWKISFLQLVKVTEIMMIVIMCCVGCDNSNSESISSKRNAPPNINNSSETANKASERSKPEIELVLIPKGDFFMGSDNQYDQLDQHPKHKVVLDSFSISKHEITRIEYAAFMKANGYATRELWSEEGWKFLQDNEISAPARWNVQEFNRPAQPVIGVSWYEAQAFAKWLGFRLPTEAEWEKAARGTDGRRYPWGDRIDRTKVEYKAFTWPRVVGHYPGGASPYGVMDMAGNVWEWVYDWYESGFYQRSPIRNPHGPERGTQKILRGGGWGSNRRHFQCSYRREESPSWRGFETGFRIVVDAFKTGHSPKI